MLKASVGQSINKDGFSAGRETASIINEELYSPVINFLYTSSKNNVREVLKGVRSTITTPIIGCTSSGAVITPKGIVTSPSGFAAMMSLEDEQLKVGVACHEAGKDARAIGRKVAIEAVENAKTTRAPAYFYMIASPKEEEKYLMGIQDVIGRVPMFGGSAADDTVDGDWRIFCNNKIINDGVAVAFFYTDSEIETSFTGDYNETNNIGIITEVKNNRTLVSIDNISALKRYSQWINRRPEELKGLNLLRASVTRPLGIKDPLGNFTIIRHPMFGNDEGTFTTADDTITLGNKIVPGTAIIQLQATVDELIDSTGHTIKDVRRKLYTEPGAYFLVHCAGRRIGIGDRLEEVYNQVMKETKGVPFIMMFTFGQYGYDEHSANSCGGLMLSFTAFGKD